MIPRAHRLVALEGLGSPAALRPPFGGEPEARAPAEVLVPFAIGLVLAYFGLRAVLPRVEGT